MILITLLLKLGSNYFLPDSNDIASTVTLPAGLGTIYSQFSIDEHVMLIATQTAKLMINLTEDRIIKRWAETDPYQVHRPFFDLVYKHGQNFTFKKLNSSKVAVVVYSWWQITESEFFVYSNLLSYYTQCCYLAKNLGSPAANYFHIIITNWGQVNRWQALSYIAAPQKILALSSTYTQFYSFSSSLICIGKIDNLVATKIRLFYNADGIYRFVLNTNDNRVVVGRFQSNVFSYFYTQKRFLQLSVDMQNIYISDLNNLINTPVQNVGIYFNISIGNQIASLTEIKNNYGQIQLIIGSTVLQIRKHCFSKCQMCSGPLQYQCTMCESGYKLISNSCVVQSNKYNDGVQLISCGQSAQQCGFVNGKEVHFICKPNYLFFVDTCVSVCPSHTVKEGNFCVWKSCALNQKKYGGNCFICSSTRFYISYADGTCNYCGNSCLTCAQANSCTLCQTTFFLGNGICNCVTAYFNNSGVCAPCSNFCLACTSQTICTACDSAHVLIFTAVCSNACPITYFNSNGVCSLCSNYCQTCTSRTICTACDLVYVLTATAICSNACPLTYFNKTGICTLCRSNCLTCTSQTICTACDSTKVLTAAAICSNACPQTYFNKTGICNLCSSQCLICSSYPQCYQCKSEAVYHKQQLLCYRQCKDGYFSLNRICTLCNYSCKACSGPQFCLSCKAGLAFTNQVKRSLCVHCNVSQFILKELCTDCHSSCYTCANIYTCSQCQKGMTFILAADLSICYKSLNYANTLTPSQKATQISQDHFRCKIQILGSKRVLSSIFDLNISPKLIPEPQDIYGFKLTELTQTKKLNTFTAVFVFKFNNTPLQTKQYLILQRTQQIKSGNSTVLVRYFNQTIIIGSIQQIIRNRKVSYGIGLGLSTTIVAFCFTGWLIGNANTMFLFDLIFYFTRTTLKKNLVIDNFLFFAKASLPATSFSSSNSQIYLFDRDIDLNQLPFNQAGAIALIVFLACVLILVALTLLSRYQLIQNSLNFYYLLLCSQNFDFSLQAFRVSFPQILLWKMNIGYPLQRLFDILMKLVSFFYLSCRAIIIHYSICIFSKNLNSYAYLGIAAFALLVIVLASVGSSFRVWYYQEHNQNQYVITVFRIIAPMLRLACYFFTSIIIVLTDLTYLYFLPRLFLDMWIFVFLYFKFENKKVLLYFAIKCAVFYVFAVVSTTVQIYQISIVLLVLSALGQIIFWTPKQ